jgi:hypothetical protein
MLTVGLQVHASPAAVGEPLLAFAGSVDATLPGPADGATRTAVGRVARDIDAGPRAQRVVYRAPGIARPLAAARKDYAPVIRAAESPENQTDRECVDPE